MIMTKPHRNSHKHRHMQEHEAGMNDIVDLGIGVVKVSAVTTMGMGLLGGMNEVLKK